MGARCQKKIRSAVSRCFFALSFRSFSSAVMAQYMEAHPKWTPAQLVTAMKEDAVKATGHGVYPNEEEILIVNMAGLNTRGTQ